VERQSGHVSSTRASSNELTEHGSHGANSAGGEGGVTNGKEGVGVVGVKVVVAEASPAEDVVLLDEDDRVDREPVRENAKYSDTRSVLGTKKQM
jgi:hypothetical protein